MLKDLFYCPQPQPTKKQELRLGAHAPHSSAIRPLPSGKMMAGHRKHPCNQVHAIILRTISVNSKQPCGFALLSLTEAEEPKQDDKVIHLAEVTCRTLTELTQQEASSWLGCKGITCRRTPLL